MSATGVRIRLWIGFSLVGAVIAALIGVSVAKSASYDLTVAQVISRRPGPAVPVTVSGTIVGGTVHWLPDRESLEFAIHDGGSVQTLYVKYHGLRPNDFTNGWPVVVTGTISTQGVLDARQLLIKCPSKYQAKPGARSA